MRRSLIFLVLILSTILAIQAQTTNVIKIGGTNAPPYRIFENGTVSGIYVDIINEALQSIGLKAEYTEMTMARSLEDMKSGAIDMMLGPNKTTEREEFMSFLLDVPLPREDKRIYLGKNTKDVIQYSDLAKLSIGVIKGTKYTDKFDNDTTLNKVEVSDYLLGLKMVAVGRIDAIIIPEMQGDYLVSKNAIAVKKASIVFEGLSSYIAISKKSPYLALSQRILSTLVKIRNEGKITAILKKYGK